MQKIKKSGGFTLVELIVVLVILAILAALLIPALTGYIDKSKRDQVVAETRMLHEAVQTVASEAYGSSGWQSDADITSLITIASANGKKITNAQDPATYEIFKNRYNEIVKLAEVPSLTNGSGSFSAVVDTKGSVAYILYNCGRGMIGAYFRESGEYKVYSEQKNIDNFNSIYATYINSLVSVATGPEHFIWTQEYVDAVLNR